MKLHFMALALPLLLPVLLPVPALGDLAVTEQATATKSGNGWRFDVTVSHPDTGWEHYTDAWRVLDMDGNELALRVLVHPHVDEQPFTRSLSGVQLPQGTRQVQIQARCQLDGWATQTVTLTLP